MFTRPDSRSLQELRALEGFSMSTHSHPRRLPTRSKQRRLQASRVRCAR